VRAHLYFIVLLPALLAAPPRAAAGDMFDAKIFLSNSGADADAMAKARFRMKDSGRERFEVKVSSMDAGSYFVEVADVTVGTLVVGADGTGKLRVEGNPLDFDPRDELVEIESEAEVVFFEGTIPDAGGNAKVDVREEFDLVDAEGQAEAEARYKAENGKVKFEVRVKKVPVGVYELLVDDEPVAEITVTLDEDGDPQGKAKFDSRFARGDKLLLSFDPLCVTLAVTQTDEFDDTTDFFEIDEFGSSEDLCF
jgi:hypothetical protein